MTELNEAQRAAVTAGDGPALVLAGAGSGKTRVIIERLAWLVREGGLHPRNLLALTFTNRAAAEMRERLERVLGEGRGPAWLGTFHAFGLHVLRREMGQLGRPTSFTVFDDSDQLSLMKRLVRDLPGGYARVSPREALHWISSLKQGVAEPGEEPESDTEEAYAELWRRYHETLLRSRAVDFDDLLVLLVRLFDEHQDVREKYRRRYAHVLVDEYQDTNRAQYLIARHLAGPGGNLFVVGDEDQSIYSWRGADINNILDFATDFPKAAVFRLERNYRSTKPILDAANALVAHNVNRLGKTLRTNRVQGAPVRFYYAEDGEDEADFVAGDIVKCGHDLRAVAILFRTNGQSRLVEEALLARDLPHVVVGGIRFYARKEIKDLLAYLRLLTNADDDEALRRIVNTPPRGIGGATLDQLEQTAAARRASLVRVLRDTEFDETLPVRARRCIGGFLEIIDDLAIEAKSRSVEDLAEALLVRIGYREYVERSDEKDARSRIEIVEEFLASCREFDASGAGGLDDFLQKLALSSEIDDWRSGTPAVTLMTCHSAKGLEFDHVYLLGLEEGLMPHRHGLDDVRDLEEERRLCYVAMTRARTTLTLTAAKTRVVYGRAETDRPLSRFIDEIGRAHLERAGAKARTGGEAEARPEGGSARLVTGTRVRHARFGPGTVMYTTGCGERLRARVRFKTGRTAMLMVSKAPLEVLEENER